MTLGITKWAVTVRSISICLAAVLLCLPLGTAYALPTHTVSGTLTDVDGAPMGGIALDFDTSDPEVHSVRVITQPDGTFNAELEEYDNYDLFVHGNNSGHTSTVPRVHFTRLNAFAVASDMSLDLRLQTVQVQLTVLDEDGNPITTQPTLETREDGASTVNLIEESPPNNNFASDVRQVGTDGTLTIPVLRCADLSFIDTANNNYYVVGGYSQNVCQARSLTIRRGQAPEPPASGFPEIISVADNGDHSDLGAYFSEISDNGRYVAYVSSANNLGAQRTDALAVYVYDRQTDTRVLASVDSNGVQEDGDLAGFDLSGDGRHVAFVTNAVNLDPNADTQTEDSRSLYIRDLDTGVTELASVDNNGDRIYMSNNFWGSLSYDGRTTVIANCADVCEDDVYVRDMDAGVTEQLPLDTGDSHRLSRDGTKVLYRRYADNAAVLYDRTTGTNAVARFTPAGEPDATNPSFPKELSADGRYILLHGYCDLPSGCLFLTDMLSHTTTRLNIANFEGSATMTPDGSVVGYTSATSAVYGEGYDEFTQAYVYVVDSGQTLRVSNNAQGEPANAETQGASLSADGSLYNLYTDSPNFGVSHMQVFVAQTGVQTGGPPAPVTAAFNAQADTHVRSGQDHHNYGAVPYLRIQSTGDNRSLVRFDQAALQTAIGSGTVLSAKLRLTIEDNGNNWGALGRTVDLHRLLTNWAEGNGTENNRGTGSGATWNCAIDSAIENQSKNCTGPTEWQMGQPNNPLVHPWAATASASQLITNQQSGTVEYDVTADVASFMSGQSSNYGWLIKKTIEGQNGMVSFGSRESANGPQLVVTYQP
jgi:hypothetical protein